MKICIAPDSFKESLTAREAAEAIASGVLRANPDCEIVCVPMADGGEGTVAAMVDATGGDLRSVRVTGPLGEPVDAEFGILGDTRASASANSPAAVIEMAAASGLALVPERLRNPLKTTTRGTGELIRAALDAGAKTIIIGIGGSATVDGGAGMAQALGVRLLDSSGNDIGPGGGALEHLASIDISALDKRLAGVRIEVACDVDNTLTGPRGAAPVYGPQKGATPQMVEQLSQNLERLAAIIKRDIGIDIAEMPGGGAAGGLGAGLAAFLGAKIIPGIDIVIRHVRLEEKMRDSQLVFTGEGRIDSQTPRGKVPAGVARTAAKLGIPAIALAGSIDYASVTAEEIGVSAMFCILDGPATLSDACTRTRELLEQTAEQVLRMFLAAKRSRLTAEDAEERREDQNSK